MKVTSIIFLIGNGIKKALLLDKTTYLSVFATNEVIYMS